MQQSQSVGLFTHWKGTWAGFRPSWDRLVLPYCRVTSLREFDASTRGTHRMGILFVPPAGRLQRLRQHPADYGWPPLIRNPLLHKGLCLLIVFRNFETHCGILVKYPLVLSIARSAPCRRLGTRWVLYASKANLFAIRSGFAQNIRTMSSCHRLVIRGVSNCILSIWTIIYFKIFRTGCFRIEINSTTPTASDLKWQCVSLP